MWQCPHCNIQMEMTELCCKKCLKTISFLEDYENYELSELIIKV